MSPEKKERILEMVKNHPGIYSTYYLSRMFHENSTLIAYHVKKLGLKLREVKKRKIVVRERSNCFNWKDYKNGII